MFIFEHPRGFRNFRIINVLSRITELVRLLLLPPWRTDAVPGLGCAAKPKHRL